MSQKLTIGMIASIALLAGGVMAWSQWSDLKSDEALAQPAPPPAETAKVLSYKTMVGSASTGYLAASQCPEIIKHLFCYCGCDETDKHTSLLDCFTTEHGMECTICVDEAVMAAQMKKDGKTIAQIQQAVDKKFAIEYPFEKPTPTLIKYRAQAGIRASEALKNEMGGLDKLKTGAAPGSCCNHKAQ